MILINPFLLAAKISMAIVNILLKSTSGHWGSNHVDVKVKPAQAMFKG
jgi:hypothetical protein